MELSDEPQTLWKPEELGEILTHQLSMPASAASFGCTASIGAAESTISLRQLLNDPRPSLDLLNTIRRAAKADCYSTSALLPRDAALVIYYASIAAALANLGQRISDLDDAKLSQAFAWTLKRRWLDAGLVGLFARAMKLLQK
jgi:hypothetical protein